MKPVASRPIVVADASILIDFVAEDSELLALAAREIWQVVVLTPVLAQVRSLDELECHRLGIEIIEPDAEHLVAATPKRRSLSIEDRLCLVYAKSLTPAGVVCTNDLAMHKEATAEKLPVCWGLDLLLELVAQGQLGKSQALTAATGILGRSRFGPESQTILAAFRAKLAA